MPIAQAPSVNLLQQWSYAKLRIPIIQAPSGSRDGIRNCVRGAFLRRRVLCARAARAHNRLIRADFREKDTREMTRNAAERMPSEVAKASKEIPSQERRQICIIG